MLGRTTRDRAGPKQVLIHWPIQIIYDHTESGFVNYI